jgi:hypothetical protein
MTDGLALSVFLERLFVVVYMHVTLLWSAMELCATATDLSIAFTENYARYTILWSPHG